MTSAVTFEELKNRGEKAVRSGQLEEAQACFDQALAWAREHLGERLSVERMATKAALSVRQFSRAFSLDVGMSPAKAIENLRVEAARSQIEAGSSQLEAIARRIGFGNVDRMRRAFVRAYGQTPQDLRRIARNER